MKLFLSAALPELNNSAHLNLSLIFVLFFMLICCRPLAVSGQQTAHVSGTTGSSTAASSLPVNECKTPLSAMKFYVVIDGRLETRTLSRRELAAASFATEGYVSGIVAVGSKGIDARVNGRPMLSVQPKADGTFSFGYYGKFKPEQLLVAGAVEENDGIKTLEPPRKPLFGSDVYSCFPMVPADTLSRDARFVIEFETGDALWRMQVRHSGGRKIAEPSEIGNGGNFVPFRYVGAQKAPVNEFNDELYQRMDAISRGIRNVESTFQAELVGTVNILEFKEIHNAVTCIDKNDIWFYINTFRQEPINELNVIAEHEALHILVDRLNLTRNTVVRKMFADLKGFDEFSIERFWIVTQGKTGSRGRLRKGEQGYFFDFISERNYLSGMKGGHPQEDLDEFCTSFLHTLMYMDRFEANLQKAEGVGIQGKELIIANYIKLLEVVRQRLNSSGNPHGDMAGSISNIRFVSERLDMIKGLGQQLQAANASSPPAE